MGDHVLDEDGGGEAGVDDVLARVAVHRVVAPVGSKTEDVDGAAWILGDGVAEVGLGLAARLGIGRSGLGEDFLERR